MLGRLIVQQLLQLRDQLDNLVCWEQHRDLVSVGRSLIYKKLIVTYIISKCAAGFCVNNSTTASKTYSILPIYILPTISYNLIYR
jgi:hypothetical protein